MASQELQRFFIKEGKASKIPISQRGIQNFLACHTRKALWLVHWINSKLGPANRWKGRCGVHTRTPHGSFVVHAVRHGNQTVWAFNYERDASVVRTFLESLLRDNKQERPWTHFSAKKDIKTTTAYTDAPLIKYEEGVNIINFGDREDKRGNQKQTDQPTIKEGVV